MRQGAGGFLTAPFVASAAAAVCAAASQPHLRAARPATARRARGPILAPRRGER